MPRPDISVSPRRHHRAMRSTDTIASRLARRQEGVFSRNQLLRHGVSPDAIDRRIRSDRWICFVPGVYGFPSHPGTWSRQVRIAILAHEGCAAGHETAAALRGWEGFGDGPIHLVGPKGINARSSIATIHRYEGARVGLVRGIPTTTNAQTAVDLCGTPVEGRVEPAMDRLLLTGALTIEELDERDRAYEGTRRNGHPFYRGLVAERREDAWRPSESALADVLRRLVRRLGDVEVEWEPSLPWRPTTKERLDAFVPSAGLILESDGRTWHGRLQDFDRDRWRDNEATAHGLAVLRFTYVHLHHRFDACLGLTHETIARRRRQLVVANR